MHGLSQWQWQSNFVLAFNWEKTSLQLDKGRPLETMVKWETSGEGVALARVS
jgi:hypothetical protein